MKKSFFIFLILLLLLVITKTVYCKYYPKSCGEEKINNDKEDCPEEGIDW